MMIMMTMMRSSYLINVMLVLLFLLCFGPLNRASGKSSRSASLMKLTVPISLDVNDPGAIEMANFAVTENNKKTNGNLKLAQILRCSGLGYAFGNFYFFKLLAMDAIQQTNTYSAKVHQFLLPNSSYTLECFQLLF
ncbi:hypothetical protein HN51_003896 [Arachis hypogaea]